jgi:predicted dinucleotide-binding enzyme
VFVETKTARIYARTQRKLDKLAREAGKNSRAGTPREAAQDADALLLAVHWSRVDDVLEQAGDQTANFRVQGLSLCT